MKFPRGKEQAKGFPHSHGVLPVAQGRCEDDGAKTARKSLRREGEKPANEMKRNVCINDLIEFQCKFS